jgi:sugar lactone lactonase YvrE
VWAAQQPQPLCFWREHQSSIPVLDADDEAAAAASMTRGVPTCVLSGQSRSHYPYAPRKSMRVETDSHPLLYAITYLLMNALNDSAATSVATSVATPAKLVDVATLATLGTNLHRPECVLATVTGDCYVADWRGGVTHIAPGGQQRLYTGPGPDGLRLLPNGIALLRDGSFLLAHLGEQIGGVYRLQRNGQVAPWLLAVDGVDLPPTNFVVEDHAGRFWVTVSTRLAPRALGYRRGCNDGFIVRVDARGATVVADGLGYTNEVAVHPSGQWLYVVETFARRLSRFALHADGTLGGKEVVTEFGAGSFPDGLAFDEAGCVWVASIVSNRLICVAPDGSQQLWLQDADEAHLEQVESAFDADQMGRAHLLPGPSRVLKNISSIAFTGACRRTALLGSLQGETLHTLAMPVAGVAPTHWCFGAPL